MFVLSLVKPLFYKVNSKYIEQTMFYTVDQFKEVPAGAQKIKLAEIIKHHQMRLQVAETFLNENLKTAD